jgi:O-antigen ligase
MNILYYLPEFLAFFAVNNIIWFTPSFGNGYYIVLGVVFILLLAQSKGNFRISGFWFALLLACAISILVNNVPTFFRPWLRLATFALGTALLGPFFRGAVFCMARVHAFWMMHALLLFVCILSFLSRLGGFGRVVHGYWCGVTVHPIMLGYLVGQTLILLMYLLYRLGKLTRKGKVIIIGCILIAFILLLGAASRAAFLACVAGGVVFHFLANRGKLSRVMKVGLALLVIASVTYSLWRPYAERMIQKNAGEITELDFASREGAWQMLWKTFAANPVFGVGFSAVDMELGSKYVNIATGQAEVGSSWLMILSMTGLCGGFVIAMILLRLLQCMNVQYRFNPLRTSLLAGLLVFHFFHMMAEGYILAAGGMPFFGFWLLLGTIDAYSQIEIEAADAVEDRYITFVQRRI